jgi:hypothetical protein
MLIKLNDDLKQDFNINIIFQMILKNTILAVNINKTVNLNFLLFLKHVWDEALNSKSDCITKRELTILQKQ